VGDTWIEHVTPAV